MEMHSGSGGSGDGTFPVPLLVCDRVTSPKIYWHAASSAVIKALGSRKAKGTGECREGEISQILLLSTKIKRDGKRRSMYSPRFQLLRKAKPLFAGEWETTHSKKLILI